MKSLVFLSKAIVQRKLMSKEVLDIYQGWFKIAKHYKMPELFGDLLVSFYNT